MITITNPGEKPMGKMTYREWLIGMSITAGMEEAYEKCVCVSPEIIAIQAEYIADAILARMEP